MITDFSDFCTWMYVIIDDLYQELAPDKGRPGPSAQCSDAELLTMTLVGEAKGWHQETEMVANWKEYRGLFPRQLERSRLNRRRRALAQTLNHLRNLLMQKIDIAADSDCIIDSLPIPVVQFYHAPRASSEWKIHQATFGKCASKKETIFG